MHNTFLKKPKKAANLKNIGDKVDVRVTEIDAQGRIKITMVI
ncbi:MAG: hypothetical protein NTZ10_02340 [Candidatus Saganbacteria bacterium]|nr:hypothetical protein [Candidatus Saganbacteria bacterium]